MNVDIRQERKKRGWTQHDVAKQVGITLSAVQKLEVGQREPSYKVYCKLMSLFGYEHPRFVFGESGGDSSHLTEP